MSEDTILNVNYDDGDISDGGRQETPSEMGSPARTANSVAELKGRLDSLESSWAENIGRIVRQQTILALAESPLVSGAMAQATPKAAQPSARARAEHASPATSVRLERHAGGEIIDPFDPDGDMNVDRWITQIDQLGEVHNWTPNEKVAIMQSRLRGQARTWFGRLDSYDFTWADWKRKLKAAFPRRRNYASSVRACLARVKLAGESITRYYQDKLALCEQCLMAGEQAVSMIIDGLPEDLQGNAYAQRASNPEELYCNYLSQVGDYNRPVQDRRASTATRTARARAAPAIEATGGGGSKVRCYNCQQMGDHFSKDCPAPRQERCMRCGQRGHKAQDCSRRGPQADSQHHKQIRVVSAIFDPKFKRMAYTEAGEQVKVYLDTGSEHNVMATACAERLGLPVEINTTWLRGFGGVTAAAHGKTRLRLRLGELWLDIKALVTDCDISDADLLLGQPTLGDPKLAVVIEGGRARLVQTKSELTDGVFRALCASYEGETNKTFNVYLAKDINVPPGVSNDVPVKVDDLVEGAVVIDARMYDTGRSVVAIPGTIFQAGDNFKLRISNLADAPLEWKAGRLIARAYRCRDGTKEHAAVRAKSQK